MTKPTPTLEELVAAAAAAAMTDLPAPPIATLPDPRFTLRPPPTAAPTQGKFW
jgi:hypothetical protein